MAQKQRAPPAGGAALYRLMMGALLLFLVWAVIAVPVAATGAMVGNWTELKSTFDSPDVTRIIVADNITMEGTINVTRAVTLQAFNLAELTPDGPKSYTINQAAFNIMDGGLLILGQEDKTHSGHVTLYNEKISPKCVHISGAGEFIMNSGVITNFIPESGHTPISNCEDNYGSGVYVEDGGTFTMNSGTISGNNATADYGSGDGVRVECGTFMMNGGTISGNSATEKGGGVYLYDYGSIFKMKSGSISGNRAEEGGGGVFANYGTFKGDEYVTKNSPDNVVRKG